MSAAVRASRSGTRPLLVLALSLLAPAGCVVDSVCYDDSDCESGRFCDTGSGRCYSCGSDADCPSADEICMPSGRCEQRCPVGSAPLDCPDGMVSVNDAFCIDVYEASRDDATEEDAGVDSWKAYSRPGVLPWQVGSNAEAQAACRAVDKDLCTEREWYCACRGPEGRVYAYGDDYEPTTCNGIDKYCFCDACGGGDCPFAGCYTQCGSDFRLEPTGENTGCTNAYGVFDINGNLWEHVKGGDETRIRGGAFNCVDSKKLHRCDYIPTDWTPSARGFRCCWRPEGQ